MSGNFVLIVVRLQQFLPLRLWICVLFQVFISQLFVVKKLQKPPAQVSKLAYLATLVVKNSSKLGFNSLAQAFASRSRLLLVSYYVTSLIRLLLIARVCRSNLGNKRTRFTHYQHRMAHTLRHFCSFSSIGTDTRCCSTPCRFCFENYTCMRNILSLCFRGIFDCLFIDSFCDLCPTRHHKRGATRDYSQQNSSIALLLSPVLGG